MLETDSFIDDSELPDAGDVDVYMQTIGKCMNVLGEEDDGTEVICGDACNPSEQVCHSCRNLLLFR